MKNPFKITAETTGNRTVITLVADYLEPQMIHEVSVQLANKWVEIHGTELLAKLAPGDVEKVVKDIVAKKVLETTSSSYMYHT